jgi:ATP-dependent DNA helicase RecG
LYNDRLEIHNPGLLPLGVTPGNILHTSVKRNELLANVFYALKLMEREGSGYDMMYARLLSQAKQLPLVEELNDRVTVTIRKRIIKEEIVEFVEKADKAFQLRQKEMISLGLIAQHNSLTAHEFSKILDMENDEKIRNWLGRLPEFDIIHSKGKTKGLYYFINPIILKTLDFKGKTNLKRIENPRLAALIKHDLEIYSTSSTTEIQKRIGSEISLHRIRKTLENLNNTGEILIVGKKKGRRYSLIKIHGK